MNKLPLDQKAMNFETSLHIQRVRDLLNVIIRELLHRGEVHDLSKLATPEVELFTEMTPRLSDPDVAYGSPAYKECLAKLGPALQHHYAHNRHHPEHFENGVDGMNLIDLLEMICDWKAAGERHHNGGSLLLSIQINQKRFGLSEQLVKILMNSIPIFGGDRV